MEENGTIEKPVCLNCGKKRAKKGEFCPHCGAKVGDGRVSMKDLVSKFWTHFSHLDSKFVKMCWQLLIPAKVSLAYFSGKSKQYPHPVQFFFIIMFFFLLSAGKYLHHLGFQSKQVDDQVNISLGPGKIEGAESISLFESLRDYVIKREIHEAFDSMPVAWKTKESRLVLDSVSQKVFGPEKGLMKVLIQAEKEDSSLTNLRDSIPMHFFNRKYTFALKDLVICTPEQLSEKYHFETWYDKWIIQQSIKSIKEPDAFMRNLLGSTGWALLMFITLMSVILSLLYIRRKKYYVEHFIFLLHHISGDLLLLTLAFVFIRLVPIAPPWSAAFWLGLLFYQFRNLYIAMKRFYGQHWAKTTLKWMFFTAVSLPIFFILFAFSLIIIFFIF